MYYSDLITAAVGSYLLHDVCSYNCPKVLSSVRSLPMLCYRVSSCH